MAFRVSLILYALLLIVWITFDFHELVIYIGRIQYLFDLPALLLVGVGALALTLATAGSPFGSLGGLFRRQALNAAQTDKRVRSLRAFRDSALGMGLLGAIVGLILMLLNLTDPSNIGPAMGLAFISLTYGVFLALPAHAGARCLETVHRTVAEEDGPEYLALCVYGYPLVALVGFLGLLFSFCRIC